MKARISLSINKELLKKIDGLVDGLFVRSRSDAVERILREYVSSMKNAVILAGGDPKPMIVKGLNTIRPLIKVGRRTLIEDTILKAKEAGFHNFYIIGRQEVLSKIYETLGTGKKIDATINYVEEKESLGTAKTLELIKNEIKSDFLILLADHFFNFDLKKIYEFHKKNNSVCTFGIHAQTSFPFNKGIVEMSGEKIIEYYEKPDNPKTFLANTFVGFMSEKIFDYIPPGKINWSLQENVFPKLAKQGLMHGYPVSGEWVNVHTKEDVALVKKITRT